MSVLIIRGIIDCMRLPKIPKMSFARANNLLLIFIILINAYVILAPLIPAVTFWWQDHHSNRKQDLTAQVHRAKQPVASKPAVNEPNHVVVPSMLLDTPILEGPVSQTYKILAQGIWRWPNGSSPDKGGNTILIGHRFTYTQPKGILYYLNKVALGDEIAITWQNKSYVYKVSSINVVPPTQTSIEDNTTDARLTIFTCTPLWLPKDRLVVVAELETNNE
jgi:sortase A